MRITGRRVSQILVSQQRASDEDEDDDTIIYGGLMSRTRIIAMQNFISPIAGFDLILHSPDLFDVIRSVKALLAFFYF